MGDGIGSRVVVGIVVALAAAAVLSAGETTAKRAFEIADYYRAAAVGAPVVSPDGARVAFTVRRYALEEAESWSEIWLMAPDGSGQRQMTFGRHHDGSPAFFPDGKRLLFVSDRGDGPSGLWVMPVDGGEARRLTEFPAELADPVISPDGRFVAVTAEVYPECGADAECNQTIADRWEEGPLDAHLADELLYRHWNDWRDGRYIHVLLVDAASGEVVRDLTPGRWDSPTFSLGGGPGYAFSPDGASLVYVSNHEPHPERSTNSDLWLVPVGGDDATATARNLTEANRGWDGDPVFSPDGRRIAFRSQATPGYESDLFRLAVLELAGGKTTYPTTRKAFDNWVDEVRWRGDGKALYFSAEVAGRNPVYEIPLAGGAPRPVLVDAALHGWALAGEHLVYARSAVGAPRELYRAALEDGKPERLTRFNGELEDEVDIRPARRLSVEVGDGRQVEVFVVTPHGFDPGRRYPLILNVHGGPQQMWRDSFRGDWQVYPGKGYVVAFANPTGSPGYGQELVDGIACDWGGQVFRDLMRVTDALAALPYVDPERIGAMGWSYGGYMMMWFEGHTKRFQAIAAMMGVYDLRSMYGATEELWFPEHDLCGHPWDSDDYRRWSPSEYVTEFATPCLVITGERDFRVPYTQSLHFFTDLQRREVPSRLVVLPKACHWPSWYEMAFYYLVHLDWFHQHLGGGEPPWEVERFLRNEVFDHDEAASASN